MKYSIELLKADIRDELEKLSKLLHQQINEFLKAIDQIVSE